ncbi:MAG: hypothetical protein AAB359_02430, partial [Elusimicrobiota bacterium]
RVEELEQKLMNFYASVMALQTEHKEGMASDRSAENNFSAELRQAMEGLSRRLATIEEKVEAADRTETAGREAFFEEMKLRMLVAAGSSAENMKESVLSTLKGQVSGEMEATRRQLMSELAGIKQENLTQAGLLKEMLKENSGIFETGFAHFSGMAAQGRMKGDEIKNAFENMTQVFQSLGEKVTAAGRAETAGREAFFEKMKNWLATTTESSAETLKADICAFLNDRISGEMELMRRQSASELAGIKQESLAQGGLFREMLKENKTALETGFAQFARSTEAGLVKIDGARAAFEETSSVLRARSKSMDDFFLAALKSGADEHSGFAAGYANALVSQSFLKAFYSAMDEVSGALSSLEREAGSFVAGVDRERLEKTAGVSGMLLRKYFEAVGRAIGQIQTGSENVERIKLRLNERFREVFDDRL